MSLAAFYQCGPQRLHIYQKHLIFVQSQISLIIEKAADKSFAFGIGAGAGRQYARHVSQLEILKELEQWGHWKVCLKIKSSYSYVKNHFVIAQHPN